MKNFNVVKVSKKSPSTEHEDVWGCGHVVHVIHNVTQKWR